MCVCVCVCVLVVGKVVVVVVDLHIACKSQGKYLALNCTLLFFSVCEGFQFRFNLTADSR